MGGKVTYSLEGLGRKLFKVVDEVKEAARRYISEISIVKKVTLIFSLAIAALLRQHKDLNTHTHIFVEILAR